MIWDGDDFGGAKLAILCRGHVLTLLRDNDPAIPFPDRWDLPGGGREGNESPQACVLRELHEEFGLRLSPDIIEWSVQCGGIMPGQIGTWFFGAELPDLDPGHVRFGDEGQTWQLMPLADFLEHPKSIPHMVERLTIWLQSRA